MRYVWAASVRFRLGQTAQCTSAHNGKWARLSNAVEANRFRGYSRNMNHEWRCGIVDVLMCMSVWIQCDTNRKMKCVFTAKLSTGIVEENLFKHLRGMNSICIRQTTYRLICVKQIVSLVLSFSAYRSAFTGCLRPNGCLSLTEFGFLFGFTTYRGSRYFNWVFKSLTCHGAT